MAIPPGLGPGCRGFKSPPSDAQNLKGSFLGVLICSLLLIISGCTANRAEPVPDPITQEEEISLETQNQEVPESYHNGIILSGTIIAAEPVDAPYAESDTETKKDEEPEAIVEAEVELPDVEEERIPWFGTVLHSYINTNNTSVRSFPSPNAGIVFELNRGDPIMVLGISKEIDTIEGHEGHWLNIRVGEIWWGQDGWVFYTFVEGGDFEAVDFSITEVVPAQERRLMYLIASYFIDEVENNVEIVPRKLPNQDFFTFVYDVTRGSHYKNVPGAYVWHPETNEIEHIAYIYAEIESGWVAFTDDFKYILRDFGTSPDPRGLGAWHIETGERVFSGSYYVDINLQGYTINIVYMYTNWNIERLDQEIIEFAEQYRINNSVPEDMLAYSRQTGLGLVLTIVCEFDLESGVRTILDGRYIYTQ